MGLEYLFQVWDSQAPLMRNYEKGVGRGGQRVGHNFWHQGLNHVGSKSGPENEVYASQLGYK